MLYLGAAILCSAKPLLRSALLFRSLPSHLEAPQFHALPLPARAQPRRSCPGLICASASLCIPWLLPRGSLSTVALPCRSLAKQCCAVAWHFPAFPLRRGAPLCHCFADQCSSEPCPCSSPQSSAMPLRCHAVRSRAVPWRRVSKLRHSFATLVLASRSCAIPLHLSANHCPAPAIHCNPVQCLCWAYLRYAMPPHCEADPCFAFASPCDSPPFPCDAYHRLALPLRRASVLGHAMALFAPADHRTATPSRH